MKERNKTFYTVLITFVLTLALVAAAVFIFFLKYDIPFYKLLKVASIIEASYIEEYDRDKCEENAINAVLETIGDKYAVYYDEENAEKTMQLIEGYYIGIGIEIFANTERGYIEVISAYEDSPADKAGIIGGDFIKAIDGKEYTASSMADAVSYMKGLDVKNPLETPISMTIIRGEEEFTVTLNREEINMYKVSCETVDDICYIRYSGYTSASLEEFKKIINNLGKEIKGIVVDVRNNPGGEFSSAINMCDLFLEDETILYTVDKNGEKTVYSAKKGSCKLPLAIIVNGSTASAAEIFAGSMQANNRAVIVGVKTYGKGVSQTVRYLNPLNKSDGALKLTTCKNYTPDGKWINEAITPDVLAEVAPLDGNITQDAAFITAVKSLKEDK